jgi:hypothetical protein
LSTFRIVSLVSALTSSYPIVETSRERAGFGPTAIDPSRASLADVSVARGSGDSALAVAPLSRACKRQAWRMLLGARPSGIR